MNGVGPIAKRGIDVIFSSTALLILLPVMAVVVVAIRLMMGRPVFFRQVCPGTGRSPSRCTSSAPCGRRTITTGDEA